MRVASLGVARPVYYDRNATTAGQLVYGTVAPHAATTRFTVTIAAGRKAFVEAAYVDLTRITAGTTAGKAYAQLYSSNSDGSDTIISYCQFNSNTVQQYDRAINTGIAILSAGNVLTAQTFDTSTGGTTAYNISAKYTTFDA